ncbi:unnamed protein product [[Candida] boidinii]|nr:unnamed protein product [[Candida] boidinii]
MSPSIFELNPHSKSSHDASISSSSTHNSSIFSSKFSSISSVASGRNSLSELLNDEKRSSVKSISGAATSNPRVYGSGSITSTNVSLPPTTSILSPVPASNSATPTYSEAITATNSEGASLLSSPIPNAPTSWYRIQWKLIKDRSNKGLCYFFAW